MTALSGMVNGIYGRVRLTETGMQFRALVKQYEPLVRISDGLFVRPGLPLHPGVQRYPGSRGHDRAAPRLDSTQGCGRRPAGAPCRFLPCSACLECTPRS